MASVGSMIQMDVKLRLIAQMNNMHRLKVHNFLKSHCSVVRISLLCEDSNLCFIVDTLANSMHILDFKLSPCSECCILSSE